MSQLFNVSQRKKQFYNWYSKQFWKYIKVKWIIIWFFFVSIFLNADSNQSENSSLEDDMFFINKWVSFSFSFFIPERSKYLSIHLEWLPFHYAVYFIAEYHLFSIFAIHHWSLPVRDLKIRFHIAAIFKQEKKKWRKIGYLTNLILSHFYDMNLNIN